VTAALTNIEQGIHPGGPVVRGFPSTRAALLSGFYFQYTGDDHHVLQLMALPRFPAPDKIELGLHEEGEDSEYSFKVIHHLVGDARIRSFTRALDVGVGRSATVTVERPAGEMLFVLSGFQLAFHGVDHHLDEAGIVESGGSVTFRFNDKNDDDTFKFSLKYCYVPRDLFSAVGTVQGENDKGGARATIPSGKAVIRGFNCNFRSKDHHIRDLGVLAGDGRVEVFFEDKNGDDPFDWSVAWGVLRE